MKVSGAERMYGSAFAMSLSMDRALLAQFQRGPGLESSFAGLDTFLGRDDKLGVCVPPRRVCCVLCAVRGVLRVCICVCCVCVYLLGCVGGVDAPGLALRPTICRSASSPPFSPLPPPFSSKTTWASRSTSLSCPSTPYTRCLQRRWGWACHDAPLQPHPRVCL
jgi:hypothetical protein